MVSIKRGCLRKGELDVKEEVMMSEKESLKRGREEVVVNEFEFVVSVVVKVV